MSQWHLGGGGKEGFRRLLFVSGSSGGGGGTNAWPATLVPLADLRLRSRNFSIRADVWPFLLGVYGLSSTQEEREITRSQNFEKLGKQCKNLLKCINDECVNRNATNVLGKNGDNESIVEDPDSPDSHDQVHDQSLHCDNNESGITSTFAAIESRDENDPDKPTNGKDEDFEAWQRIMQLDAVRTNGEWIGSGAVGLKDYEHLEPCIPKRSMMTDIGYCQGMRDLLSPIAAIVEDDHEAFWWFVGFMKKVRHNFRLDEVGIGRHSNTAVKIIKFKGSHLYRHPEKMQAEDCFFVYRMVVVLFRRELTFEKTLCLWEVILGDNNKAKGTDAACILQLSKLIIELYNSIDGIIKRM
ncbi:hypothetical protein MKX03_002793 [Papaver bracteatum]|nr:hypothetical protein MKX03_002793 [Papaver bracteatum]